MCVCVCVCVCVCAYARNQNTAKTTHYFIWFLYTSTLPTVKKSEDADGQVTVQKSPLFENASESLRFEYLRGWLMFLEASI